MNLQNDGRRILVHLPVDLQRLDLLRRVSVIRINAAQAQRPFNGNLPISESRIGKLFRLLGLPEIEERVADTSDILFRKLAVLFAEVFAQRLEPLCGVDELHLALSVRGLLVRRHPDVGCDAGVVEHVQRQRDNGS